MTKKLPKSVKVIRAAKRILKKGWCKDYFATDKKDNPVDIFDVSACKFCLRGAMKKAYLDYDCIIPENLWIKTFGANYPNRFSLPVYNDAQTSVEPILEGLAQLEKLCWTEAQ